MVSLARTPKSHDRIRCTVLANGTRVMKAPTALSPHLVTLDVGLVPGLAHAVTAAVDLDTPEDGIVCGDDRLLGLDLRVPCPAADQWTRGGDVVAVYEPQDPRMLRATALWRRRPMADAAAWELIASATTGRARSDTSLAVVSDVAATAVLVGVRDGDRLQWRESAAAGRADCVLLRRPAEHGVGSVFIAGHPVDARRMLIRLADGRARIECWLFSAAAEKGVLFRGRVLAAAGQSPGDTAWAEKAWAEFAAAPPMLTT